MALRGPRLWIAGAVVVVVAAGGAAVPVYRDYQARQDRDRLHAAVDGYAKAFRTGQFTGVVFSGTDATTVTKAVTTATATLTGRTPDLPTAVDVGSVTEPAQDAASATLKVTWDLGQKRTWSYDVPLALKKVQGTWSVAWAPTAIHPQLAAGQTLTTSRTTAKRGEILGANGTALVTTRPVVHVGIQPARVKNLATTVAAVAALVDVDAAGLTKRVKAAKPNDFVDVITLRRDDYDPIKDKLQPIPGTVFKADTLSLAPSAGFARALLGTVGQATKEIVESSGGRVLAGDTTGLSGIQRAYDATLSGSAGITVKAGQSTVYEQPPVDGKPVTITIDQTVQQAAEAALSKATKPAGLVAIRPSTGEVLAVANGGPNAAGYNRALIGQYPPGSTFKVVTSYALLQHGITPSTPVACPPKIVVSGKTFTNAENEVLNTVPFSTDFAQSCNTAFVGSAAKITGAQLLDAATVLGYGAPNTLGVTAFMGSVPSTDDPVEHAADAIGQGKVLASPLVVASVSASVAAGKRVPVRLVTSPATADSQASGATPSAGATPSDQATPTATAASASAAPDAASPSTDATASAQAAPSAAADAPAAVDLDAGTISDLQTLMRGVVTDGTGTALKGVPGGPVHGKTGTAEFGTANPPQTHAWFTGYQGDLAFAVVVEGGGFGAKAAAPLAAAFLSALA